MPLAFAAGNTANDTTGVATTGSLGTTAAGQIIVITISDDSALTNAVTSVTDNYGNTWTKVPISATNNVLTNTFSLQMWYAVLAPGKAGASHTVTVNWNTAATGLVTVAAQYFNGFVNTPTLDVYTAATGSSTTASPGTTATTTDANEIVIIGAGRAGTASAFSLGSGYTNLSTVNAANAGVGQESKVVSATGTQTGSMTIAASRAWGAIIATFKDQSSTTNLTVANAAIGVTTDNVAVDVAMYPADSAIAVSADNVVLDTSTYLAPADAAIGVSADNVALTQQHSLTVADAAIGVTATGNSTLTQDFQMTVNNAAIGVTATNLVLTQAHFLAIDAATIPVLSPNVKITQRFTGKWTPKDTPGSYWQKKADPPPNVWTPKIPTPTHWTPRT